MGAKKMDTRKQIPADMAVKPVLPPSAMPAPDSTNLANWSAFGLHLIANLEKPSDTYAVTDDVPSKAPIEMLMASTM